MIFRCGISIPGWLLFLVKVVQIVVTVHEVEQVVFTFIEAFNEGVRFLASQEGFDKCQTLGDRCLTGYGPVSARVL